MMASRPGGALYLGVTSDIVQRVWQHKSGFVEGYARQYNIKDLVWLAILVEVHETMEGAITREKAWKRWKRAWKLRLIAEANPTWRNLYAEVV